MLAFRNAAELELLRPELLRVHRPAEDYAAAPLPYAPALSLPQSATVQQALDALRSLPAEFDTIYYLFVTDVDEHLVGVITLRRLLAAAPADRLFAIMDRRVITLPEKASLAEQARLMAQSGLMALPLIDRDGRLIGAMDAAELIAAVDAEATSQFCRTTGLDPREQRGISLFAAIQARLSWLMLSLALAFGLVWEIGFFAELFERVPMLALCLPLIVLIGGSAGLQSAAQALRALSHSSASAAAERQVLLRELAAGAGSALAIGLAAMLVGWVWQSSLLSGLVIGGAVAGTLLIAVLSGALLPRLLRSLRFEVGRGLSLFSAGLAQLGGALLLLALGGALLP